MNTFSIAEAVAPAYAQAFGRTLSLEELRHRTPAVFAGNASERTKPTYRFINKCGSQHLSINVALRICGALLEVSSIRTSGCGAPHNAAQRDRRNSISLGLVFHEVRPALRLGGRTSPRLLTSHQDPAQHKRLSYRGSHVRASLGSCSGLSQSGASA